MSKVKLSAFERALSTRLGSEAATLANSFADAVERDVSEYHLLASEGEGGYLRESFTRLILSYVEHLNQRDTDPDESFVAQTRQRAYEGLPLECILHAWRIVGHQLWLWLEAQRQGAYDNNVNFAGLWSSFLDFSDLTVDASSRAYKDAREKADLSSQMVASTTFERLLTESDSSEVAHGLRRLGVSKGPISVVASELDGEPNGAERSSATFVPLLSVITTAAGVRPPWVIHGKTLITIVEITDALKRRLTTVAEQQSKMRVGLGPSTPPECNLAEGLRRAIMALSFTSHGRRVVEADAMTVFEIVASQTPIESSDLPPWVHTFLAEDAKRSLSWSNTVDALLAHGGNVSETAEALFVHPNTIYYRLSAMRSLGIDLADPETLVAAKFVGLLLECRRRGQDQPASP